MIHEYEEQDNVVMMMMIAPNSRARKGEKER